MVRYIRRITISEGKVTTCLLDMDTFLYDDKTLQMSDDKTLQMSDDKTLQMSDVLQSLTGNCQIPRGCINGLVLCDHKTNALSTINTCAPSINISTKQVKSYENFKKLWCLCCMTMKGLGSNKQQAFL